MISTATAPRSPMPMATAPNSPMMVMTGSPAGLSRRPPHQAQSTRLIMKPMAMIRMANRTSLRRRDGTNITYSYDALDRMVRKNLPGTADDVYYGYERQGQLLEARFGSDSGQGIISAYDQLGRITLEQQHSRRYDPHPHLCP